MTVKISGNSSASTPSFAGDDGDSGLHATADQVQLVTNGTVGVTVDSSQNVGIGTTTPGALLEVNGGNTRMVDTNGRIYLQNGNTTNGAKIGVRGTSDATDGYLAFETNSIEFARFDSSGNFGIGTGSSFSAVSGITGANLQVLGGAIIGNDSASSGGSGWLAFDSATTAPTNSKPVIYHKSGVGLGLKSDYEIDLEIGANTKARIDNSGRFLVNSTSSLNSGCIFQTAGDDTTRDWAIKYTGTSGAAETGIKFLDKNNFVNAQISNNLQNDGLGSQAAHLVFKTANGGTLTERMRFEQRGIIYGYSADAGYIQGLSNGAGTIFRFFSGRHSATGANGTGSESYRVWSNGNVQNTNNSYGSISDIKLKENIVDASSQWDDLKAIQVRKYNFKEETGNQTHTQLGVVAQEIELVSPGLVSESPDTDEAGNDLGTTTKSVNYSVLYMKAVKALQEAMDRIETLETVNAEQATTIASFETRISALEEGN